MNDGGAPDGRLVRPGLRHRPPLLDRLRERTRTLHHRIDHHDLMKCLVRADIDPPAYGTALAALHGPVACLERLCLRAIADFGLRYRLHPRGADLAADLADLGRSPLPLALDMGLTPANASEAVGLLYVLEGSRLGGAVIADCLQRHLPEAPRRFFSSPVDGGVWERFETLFGTPSIEPLDAEVAALSGFRLVLSHLDRWKPVPPPV